MDAPKKKNKVRTSITIDPDLLAQVRKDAEHSVSAYIESALRHYQQTQEEAKQAADAVGSFENA